MSLVKSLSVGVVRAGAGKFIAGESLKRGAKVGAVLGVSSYVSGSVIQAIPMPSIWSFMMGYEQDVVSSLITATVAALWMKQAEGASKFKSFLRELLYSFGSCVVGGYISPMLSPVLPASLQQ